MVDVFKVFLYVKFFVMSSKNGYEIFFKVWYKMVFKIWFGKKSWEYFKINLGCIFRCSLMVI